MNDEEEVEEGREHGNTTPIRRNCCRDEELKAATKDVVTGMLLLIPFGDVSTLDEDYVY